MACCFFFVFFFYSAVIDFLTYIALILCHTMPNFQPLDSYFIYMYFLYFILEKTLYLELEVSQCSYENLSCYHYTCLLEPVLYPVMPCQIAFSSCTTSALQLIPGKVQATAILTTGSRECLAVRLTVRSQ